MAGAAAGRQIVNSLRDYSVHITIKFMVTQDMDQVNAVHSCSVKNLGKRIPVCICGAVIHRVACLDSETIRYP